MRLPLSLPLAAALLFADCAQAQTPARRTIWDLPIGAHARELPQADFVEFACGTNGGPPSAALRSWADFQRCPVEDETGLREVYFRYDDEREYIDKAQSADDAIVEGTTEFQQPVIVSVLFDKDGFVAGLRMATDPRAAPGVREKAANLFEALRARLGGAGWACSDLPRAAGETPYRGVQDKRRCERTDRAAGLRLVLEQHFYRKAGQTTLDPVTGAPTTGQFISLTRFERFALAQVSDPQARLAAIVAPPPNPVQVIAAKLRDCPGCDARETELKRADLRGARLAGADLSRATLHGANLSGADLTGAKLAGANLNRADLRQAKLAGADLSNALLYGARLDGADLTGADLSSVLARSVQMNGANAARLVAQGADLRAARLLNVNLGAADLAGAVLREAQLARANLSDARLYDAQLWRANLSGSNLARVQAQGAELIGADLRGADLTGGDFTDADLRQIQFSAESVTAGARFDNAQLPPGFGGQ